MFVFFLFLFYNSTKILTEMDIKRLNSLKVASAIGSYSHASIVGETIYLSGQLGLDQEGNLVSGGIESETEKVLENIEVLLDDFGSNLSSVIKTTIFLKNMEDYQKVNEIYNLRFMKFRPARSCIEVSALPKGANIEIEVIANVS